MPTKFLQMAVSTVAGMCLPIAAAHAAECYDFDEVDALASGAIQGENVALAVEGFDLLLMRDGRVVFHRAYGQWHRDRVAATDSATKTVSGALIMALVEDPLVPMNLDTRLMDHIPEFDGDKAEITIRQCFAHMAGFGYSPTLSNWRITLQDAALEIADDELEYPAGTTFRYGGTSMHAAGAVAEVAAGEPWNALFEKHLTMPLGLQDTRFVLSGPTNPRIAGGIESTASDMARFMEMLRLEGRHGDVRVLEPWSVDEMLTRQTPVDVPIASSPVDIADYGVGIWLDRRDAHGDLEGALAAGARGFSAWIDLDDRMVGVFATDLTQSGNVREVVDLIRDAAEAAVRNPVSCPPYRARRVVKF
jgi:CubicO group peptidase (beta-lactamase class C family)